MQMRTTTLHLFIFIIFHHFCQTKWWLKAPSNNINECEIIPNAPSIPSHITSHSRSKYKPAEDCEWEDLQWQTVQFNLPREYSHPHTNANEIKSRISTCIHGICTEQLDKVSRRVALSSTNTPERERVQLISAVWCVVCTKVSQIELYLSSPQKKPVWVVENILWVST